MYKPSNIPNLIDDVPRFLGTELRKLSGDLHSFAPLRMTDEFDLSASATVTLPDAAIPSRGISIIAMTGAGSPRSTIAQIQRTGTANGCYILFNTYVGQEWAFGTTSEPAYGLEGRVWIDGSSAGASMKIKNLTANNVKFRVLSVEI